jgi:hypothetical protein
MTDLSKLARDLAAIDNSGKRDLNIVQIRECLAALGAHLRRLTAAEKLSVFQAITTRAGIKSKNTP